MQEFPAMRLRQHLPARSCCWILLQCALDDLRCLAHGPADLREQFHGLFQSALARGRRLGRVQGLHTVAMARRREFIPELLGIAVRVERLLEVARHLECAPFTVVFEPDLDDLARLTHADALLNVFADDEVMLTALGIQGAAVFETIDAGIHWHDAGLTVSFTHVKGDAHHGKVFPSAGLFQLRFEPHGWLYWSALFNSLFALRRCAAISLSSLGRK